MNIDEIREIVISPDAIMKKEYGKVLLDEIDRLTTQLEQTSIVYMETKVRAEKAEAKIKKYKAFWEWSRQADKMTFELYVEKLPEDMNKVLHDNLNELYVED